MRNVLILGASGQIARWVTRMLAGRDDLALTLFLHDAGRLAGERPAEANVVEGDVLDAALLGRAVAGQDVVYANLSGEVDRQAQAIVAAMQRAGVKRLIFVASLGIYDEVPGPFGEWNQREIGDALKAYRRAADTIEAAGLQSTIVRPAWLTDDDEIDYETTRKDQPFCGTEVSRRSVAALIVSLIDEPWSPDRANLGVNKPNTDGDKPAFM